jgi:UDPglucose--hexose-1-phosphate uridylyltransferase
MVELRQKVTTGEWVIIAPARAQRPQEQKAAVGTMTAERSSRESGCPFCPGNEEPALELFRVPQEEDWQLRVLQNKYPSVQPDGERVATSVGLHNRVSGVGQHLVLVESRQHNTCVALMSSQEAAGLLQAFQRCGRLISQDQRVAHIAYFENHGPRAGTTLSHPHAQLVGLPVVPHSILVREQTARQRYEQTGTCIYCQLAENALLDGRRVVLENEACVAFVPYAAASPYHVWILPRQHRADFSGAGEAELAQIGAALRQVLRKLYDGLADPDYNYIIRSAPLSDTGHPHLHWYLAILPRVSRATGFELGTGIYINTVPPEESAAFLRSIPVNE